MARESVESFISFLTVPYQGQIYEKKENRYE